MGCKTDQKRCDLRDQQQRSDSVNDDEMVILGRIASPFGIKGWLRLTPYTASPEDLLDYSELWMRDLQQGWIPCPISDAKLQNRSLLVALEGIEDRTAAELICRREVAVPASSLPDLEADEFYWRDLLGMSVLTPDGAELGQVYQIVETGANDVLVVLGEKEHWIPFLMDRYIRSVNLSERTIIADWDPEF